MPPVLYAIDDREDYGEERFIGYGQVGEAAVIAVASTIRDGRVRLISAPKASRKEVRKYYGHLEETG